MIDKKGKAKIEDFIVDFSKKATKRKRNSPPASPVAKKTTKTKKTKVVKKDKVDIKLPDKIKKADKTKKVPTIYVDAYAPQNIKNTCEVYKDNDYVWHATLNQTNLKGNNNKFYICQLLKGGNNYHCWFRWGRVGYEGQNSLSSGDFDTMKNLFCKKYSDKTGNVWGDPFVSKAGKYTFIEVDESNDDDKDNKEEEKEEEEEEEEEVECKLPEQIQVNYILY